jgi:carbonic anhydrase
MSIFGSQTTWQGACASANQSPINLTHSGSKPCNMSCDLVMDDGFVSQASIEVSDEGLLLVNYGGLGTCKFRGESYVCTVIVINHPSHHTIEGVQADGECIAFLRNPTGGLLCLSVLFRVSPSETGSYSFFKQFVPYAQTTSVNQQVSLQNWSLSMMIPSESSFYTYAGSTTAPDCHPCEWVVFRNMVNMDTTDFAYLVRNVSAGSRSVQALGNREVFYNDTKNMPGAMPHDNKFYLKLGNPLKKNKKYHVKKVDLKTTAAKDAADEAAEERNPSTWHGAAWKATKDHVAQNGGFFGTLESIFILILILTGLWLGYSYGGTSPFKPEFAKNLAIWFRSLFIRKTPDQFVPT